MSKRVIIPFWIWPYSWGLKGDARKIAKLEYELEGEELERKVAEVKYHGKKKDRVLNEISFRYGHCDDFQYEFNKINFRDDITEIVPDMLALQLKYNRITEYQYDLQLAEHTLKGEELEKELLEIKLNHNIIDQSEYREGKAKWIEDPTEKAIELLTLKFENREIPEHEFNKELATLKGEAFISMIEMDVDLKNPNSGAFVLDWNDVFIEQLEEAGYTYPQPEQAVNAWWNDLCKNIALEEFDGVGDFTERVGGADKSKERIDDERWSKK